MYYILYYIIIQKKKIYNLYAIDGIGIRVEKLKLYHSGMKYQKKINNMLTKKSVKTLKSHSNTNRALILKEQMNYEIKRLSNNNISRKNYRGNLQT